MAVVIIALAIQLFSIWLDILLMSGVSFIMLLFGIVLFFLGGDALRFISFPFAFLVFMIPLPVLGYFLGYPLQVRSAALASALLGLVGFDLMRDGTKLHLSSYTFVVDEPCSGLKGGIALLAMGTLIAYSSRLPLILKPALVLLALPIALLMNGLRIALTMALGQLANPFFADRFFHYLSGLLFFTTSVASLYGTASLLERLIPHEDT